MAYVDMFVFPVPTDQLDRYFELAREFADIWKAAGALSVTELRPDDVAVGSVTSFPRAVQASDGESVVVGYVTYRDRAHRDAVNAQVMSDPKAGAIMEVVPTDGKRMFWGGFVAEVEA